MSAKLKKGGYFFLIILVAAIVLLTLGAALHPTQIGEFFLLVGIVLGYFLLWTTPIWLILLTLLFGLLLRNLFFRNRQGPTT